VFRQGAPVTWPDSKRHPAFLASQLPCGSPICLRPFVEARKDGPAPSLRRCRRYPRRCL